MNRVHIVMQGKGGVGKSTVANMLAQFHQASDRGFVAVDTDPVNHTLSTYKGLNARVMEVLSDSDQQQIDPRKFDLLMEAVMGSDVDFVIDTGATSFLPFGGYLVENSGIEMLADAGKEVFIHSVVVGGEAMGETVRGLVSVTRQFPETAKIVVWLNEYFGLVEREEAAEDDGVSALDRLGGPAAPSRQARPFEQFKVYPEIRSRIHGIVRLYKQNPATTGKDLEQLAKGSQTFGEALSDPKWSLMARQRIKKVRDSVFDQLRAVLQ